MTELYEDEKAQICLQMSSDSPETLINSLMRASQDKAKTGASLTK